MHRSVNISWEVLINKSSQRFHKHHSLSAMMAGLWRWPWINMIWLACTSLTVFTSVWGKGHTGKVQPQTKSTTHWMGKSKDIHSSSLHSLILLLLLLQRNWELIDSNIHFSPGIRATAKSLKRYWLWLQEPGPTSLIYSQLERSLLTNSQRWTLDKEQGSRCSGFSQRNSPATVRTTK